MTQVKCPACFEKLDADSLEPREGWSGDQNDVKCPFCKSKFQVTCEVTYETQSDFDTYTFTNLYDLKTLPNGVDRKSFHKALKCIIDDRQEDLKLGFDSPGTKTSFEFAIIHHQRVRRSFLEKSEVKS